MTDDVRHNLELKARTQQSVAELAAAAKRLGAVDEGWLNQRDTYFAATRGRLKLREQTPGHAQLIQYHREDQARARDSSYRLVEIEDPEGLVAALGSANGVTAVVSKRRRLLLRDNVRTHLDVVEGLGRFIELEAVVPAGGVIAAEQAGVDALANGLGITADAIESRSYADLLHSVSVAA